MSGSLLMTADFSRASTVSVTLDAVEAVGYCRHRNFSRLPFVLVSAGRVQSRPPRAIVAT